MTDHDEPPVRRCDWRGRKMLGDPRAVLAWCDCYYVKGWRKPFPLSWEDRIREAMEAARTAASENGCAE